MSDTVAPRLLLIATGGTIASDIGADDRKVYRDSEQALAPLVRIVGETGADVRGEQIVSIGSQDMALPVWIALHSRIRQCFEQDEADAVIITHGTDTMEETAFFLDLTCSWKWPIIITGAMRPANADDADGPANLSFAVRVATDPRVRERGVLVAMAGRAHDARSVRKAATEGEGAFQSDRPRGVCHLNGETVGFGGPAVRPILADRYACPGAPPLPAVAILYCHADMDTGWTKRLLEQPPCGIVVAGIGDGNIPAPIVSILAHVAAQGCIVVRSTRIGGGFVPKNAEIRDEALGFVAAGDLSPQKARILLQLLLANGVRAMAEIQRAFDPE